MTTGKVHITMQQLHIALLQMNSCDRDQAANLVKGELFCRRAQAMGADIALFPEMWNVGYSPAQPLPEGSDTPEDDLWKAPEKWQNREELAARGMSDPDIVWQGQAIARDSSFIRHFQQLARELKMAIALTYLEAWTGAPRNSVSLIDRHGEIVLTYAKMHTCAFSWGEAALTPGDTVEVCTLDTAQGPVQVGAMICYDREFPETARLLMLQGAEIILVPNACELEINRLAQFRTRAYENMVGVAMANYAAPQQNGHSIAFDGIAYGPQGSRDMLLIEAGEGEGIYIASFDLEALRDFRLREALGNTFRRPHLYGAIIETQTQPPFIRVNAQGKHFKE
jgi:N-carbamoylputrescine amidase